MPPKKYHATTIDCRKIRPHAKELIDRCGGRKAAAEYSFVPENTLYRIINGVNCNVQHETAKKILVALEHRREEDRLHHEVSERFRKARQEQARIERGQGLVIPNPPESPYFEE